MTDLLSLAHDAVTAFQHHQPWLGDKLGGAVITQTIRELWEQTKAKLGAAATAKVEAKPDDAVQWEVLKGRLLDALDQDEAFRSKVQQELSKSVALVQQAIGDNNKQISVAGSQDVKINVD
ncbi:MAG: hypothetical protein JO051_01590 [Acidobacteriaceae bacterium]|nr:hypothetical protein [Acidobacteriaceae bacterium]